MTYDEYVQAMRRLVLVLIAALIEILNPLRRPALGPGAWVGLLSRMYSVVEQGRRESAELAREFYDAEKRRQVGGPRQDIYLANYDPEWFYEAMEPARRTFSRSDATEEALSHVIGIAVKEVENAGRTTIRQGAEANNTRERRVGWARVQGGQESCAFCLMLISRGPVYRSARTAGLNTDDQAAKQLIGSGDDAALDELMTRWHPNCDCKVVPVFDQRKSWPGKDHWKFAEQVWINASGRNSAQKLKSIRRFLDEQKAREPDSRPEAA